MSEGCSDCKKCNNCKIEQLMARFEEKWIGDMTVGEIVDMNPVWKALSENCSLFKSKY